MPAPEWIITDQGDMIETAQINYIQVVKNSVVLSMSNGGSIRYPYESAAAAATAKGEYVTSFSPTTIELVPIALIPDMTSNTTPSGTVSASQEAVGPAWFAFDQSNASQWVSTNGGNPVPQWIQYEFSSAQTANRYSIRSSGAIEYITSLTLEGSNDGASWVVLDTQTGLADWVGEPLKEFDFNVASYIYFRWTVTAINGTVTGIIELQLYYAP